MEQKTVVLIIKDKDKEIDEMTKNHLEERFKPVNMFSTNNTDLDGISSFMFSADSLADTLVMVILDENRLDAMRALMRIGAILDFLKDESELYPIQVYAMIDDQLELVVEEKKSSSIPQYQYDVINHKHIVINEEE